MPTNPYVRLFDDRAEQQLLQELTDETISMFGFDVVYLPATLRREDVLYNEDVLRQYTQTYTIEAYIVNVDGWQGQNNLMSKFGLQLNQQTAIRISRARFQQIVGQVTGQSRPYEGDMVYFGAPFNRMFEITFVEHQNQPGQFYPLGGLTYYHLQLELHTQNQEQVATTDTDINAAYAESQYAIVLELSAGGTGTYTVGETVTQDTSTAIVSAWDAATTRLTIHTRQGEFQNGVSVVGQTSGASYVVGVTPNRLENPNEAVDDNNYLDIFAASIVDTREVNRSVT